MSDGHVDGFLDDLKFRGLVNQCTDEAGLRGHLTTPGRRAYVGFDPTADSLTIGNLVGIVTLARWQRAGHVPVVVMGGGTGLIGDPSGKSAERQLRSVEEVRANVESQRRIFERVLDFSKGACEPRVLNNYDWLGKLSYLEALRDVGKHFSVNMMIQKDSVKERLTNRDQGISYTEFSYMILQAYDFAHLYEHQGVTVQMGGSDQFGNIVCGLDLVKNRGQDLLDDVQGLESRADHFDEQGETEKARQDRQNAKRTFELFERTGRLDAEYEEIQRKQNEAEQFASTPLQKLSAGLKYTRSRWNGFGLTWPLVTKADGTKFGKSESGAIWLTANSGGERSPNRTSAYQFYQFWLNSADADVPKFLRFFTMFSREEILALEATHVADPGKREAHRALARHMTTMLHGEDGMKLAEAAAGALFSGEIAQLPMETLEEVLAAAPSSNHDRSLLSGEGVTLLEVLAQTSLAKSKAEARTFLSDGSVSVNGVKAGADARLTVQNLLHGKVIALRRGKKSWHVTRWG